MIPYGRQEITEEDIDAVVSTLRSNFLTQGPSVEIFEKAVATYCGVRHAISFNSATSALHVACRALGLSAGDWLWTSPISFVASANCGRYCGAQVDFVDIEPDTYNMSVEALEEKLQRAEFVGCLPKVVIPVHLCGQSCDMARIAQLARKYDFKVIEDASHALGGRFSGDPIGHCSYSDIAVFSFHPVKIVTTAEGGVAVTNDEQIAQNMGLLRSHGITREPSCMVGEPDGPWYYEQLDLGFNYRMNDVQAALGTSQMKRLDSYVRRRHTLARRYQAKIAELPLETQRPVGYSAFHLFVVRLRSGGPNFRRKVFESLRESGIGVNIHYKPIHTQPYYQSMGFNWGDFPEAEAYYRSAISLPLYPTMTSEQQDRVVDALNCALAS